MELNFPKTPHNLEAHSQMKKQGVSPKKKQKMKKNEAKLGGKQKHRQYPKWIVQKDADQ